MRLWLVIDSFLTLNSSSDPRGIFVSQMSARILSRYFGRLRAVSLFSLSVEQTPEDLESLFCLIRDVISYNVKLAGSSSFSWQLFFYYLERGSHLGQKRTGGGVISNRPLPRYKTLTLYTRLSAKPFLWKKSFICIKIQNHFRITSHPASIWKRILEQLGNGLKTVKKYSKFKTFIFY